MSCGPIRGLPEDVRAKLIAGHRAIARLLDRQAVMGGNRPALMDPLADKGRIDVQPTGQLRLATDHIHCDEDWIGHGVSCSTATTFAQVGCSTASGQRSPSGHSIAPMDKEKPKPTPESRAIKAALDALKGKKTRSEVAAEVGVDPTLISQWSLGRRPVARDRAVALAEAIGEKPERLSVEYRDAAVQFGVINGTAVQAPEHELDTELHVARLENDVHALNLFLGALVATMVQHRPTEAKDVAALVRRQVPKRFRDKGLLHELVSALDRSSD
jgi:transcriptional regulator with XRE-family HTH domain